MRRSVIASIYSSESQDCVAQVAETTCEPACDTPASGEPHSLGVFATGLALPAMLTLLAFGLRLVDLVQHPLWWDEGISIYLANQSVYDIIRDRLQDVHPPLYFLLLRSWIQLFGSSAWACRLLSVFAGTLAIPALYRLSSNVAGRRVGLVSAALLAIHPFLLFHAREARMYALMPLLGLLSLLLLQSLLRRFDFKTAAGYVLLAEAMLYAHYYGALAVLAELLYGVVALERSERKKWLATSLLIGLLYLPWFVALIPNVKEHVQGVLGSNSDPAPGLFEFLGDYAYRMAVGYVPADQRLAVIATGLFSGALVLGLAVALRRLRGKGSALLACYALVTLLGGWAVNGAFPHYAFPRLLALVVPLCYTFMVIGLVALWDARPTVGVLVALLVFGLTVANLSASYRSAYHPAGKDPKAEDYRPLVRRVEALGRPQDAVICDFLWQAGYIFAYHGQPQPRIIWAPGEEWAATPGQMEHDLDEWMAEHRLVWYVAYQGLGGTQGRNIESYLVQHYYPVLDEWCGHTRLLSFSKPSVPKSPIVAKNVLLGDQVELVGYTIGQSSLRGGEVVTVALYWRALQPIEGRYKTFVHLLNDEGCVVAQRDSEPLNGARPTLTWEKDEALVDNHGILLLEGIAPGSYLIEVGMYDLESGERLSIAGGGDHILLDEVVVAD